MKLVGTITTALPKSTGVGKNGKAWSKATFVLTYDENTRYPKSICFDVFNEKIAECNLEQGKRYEVDIDFDAREYQGKYFNSVTAWKAVELGKVVEQAAANYQATQNNAYSEPF